MSTEPEPNQSPSPAKAEAETPKNQDAAAKEAAAKALGDAKQKMTAGVEAFKKLGLDAQIYLAALAVTVLCSIIFSAIGVTVKADGPMADILKQGASSASVAVIRAGANGFFAVLAAAAGIGLWIWNFTAKKKEAWAPLAIAGAAGLSALLFLVLWLRSGTNSTDVGGIHISVHMTLLGFWLPFAGAVAATAVSVKRILNSAPAPTTPAA
jgi:hypothetical protein